MFSEVKRTIKALLDRKRDPFLNAPKTPKNRLAYLISRFFGPTPLVCLLWLFATFNSGIGFEKAIWVYPLIFSISIAIPIIISTYLVVTKKVKDIEWSDIKQREKYMPPIIAFSLTSLTILVWLFTTNTMFHLVLVFDVIAIAMIAIYRFFNLKASLHIMFATTTFAGLVLYIGLEYWWVFLLILPIMWARRTLKVHTWPELIAGFFVPAAIMISSVLIFGWPHI